MTVHHLLWAISLLLQLGTSAQKVNIYLYLTPTCSCLHTHWHTLRPLDWPVHTNKTRNRDGGKYTNWNQYVERIVCSGYKVLYAFFLNSTLGCHFTSVWYSIFLIIAACREEVLAPISTLSLTYRKMISQQAPALSVVGYTFWMPCPPHPPPGCCRAHEIWIGQVVAEVNPWLALSCYLIYKQGKY